MSRSRRLCTILLALVATFLLAANSIASDPPLGSSKMWPWNIGGYRGYNEPPRPAQPPIQSQPSAAPQKYAIQIMVMPQASTGDNSNTVALVAHLPPDAQIWIDDFQSKQKGEVRQYESPPLKPGVDYRYTVRVNWVEDGRLVSQARVLQVHAGEVQCIDLVPYDSLAPDSETRVEVNLAKLSPEDRTLAENQRFCVMQDQNRLGAMGPPVKLTLNGQPVFVCCKGCVEKAQGNPEKAVAKVKELQAKNGGPSRP
jgi:uncharacterized protein (TIGR03000 family)